jgi:hypothetical protein
VFDVIAKIDFEFFCSHYKIQGNIRINVIKKQTICVINVKILKNAIGILVDETAKIIVYTQLGHGSIR